MRVFVTGASGFIGTAVVGQLLDAGHTVTGLARSAQSERHLATLGAEVVRGSLDDLTDVAAAAADAEGVVHLAYRHADPVEDAVHTDSRVIDTIGDALTGTGKPFVFASGTLVLAPGRIGTEADRPDSSAPAAARGRNEAVGLAYADHDVRVSAVRLAPSVHDQEKRGFAGALVDIAAAAGEAAYVADGHPRWPTVHRQDAARLIRLALEHAPAGAVLHGVGEEGVILHAVAEVIAAGLHVPVRPVAPEEAAERFGWLAPMVTVDAAASSVATQTLLDWTPTHAGLLHDMQHGHFF